MKVRASREERDREWRSPDAPRGPEETIGHGREAELIHASSFLHPIGQREKISTGRAGARAGA